jgi:branched-chain amino acid transport system substrate-binding protein
VSNASKVFAVAVLVALVWSVPPIAEAQPPIRIGAALSQTGLYAALRQNKLRGYPALHQARERKGWSAGTKARAGSPRRRVGPATAARLYERLITQDKVGLVLGPYGSPITDAVANVTERHKLPMVGDASATSIYRKGRTFIFSMNPPAEVYLEGLVDMGAKKGSRPWP